MKDCEVSWDKLIETLQSATRHVFGKKKKSSLDCFYDQDAEIQTLLRDKWLISDRNALRSEIRKLKNKWF